MDMKDWVHRAAARIRRMAGRLDGEWGIRLSITPPPGPAVVDEFLAALPIEFPEALANLYRHACDGCILRYSWTAGPESQSRYAELQPHLHSLYGGVELLPWSRLQSAVSDMLDGGSWGWEGWDPPPGAPWRLPLVYLGNGDAVAWTVDEHGLGPVEFLCHERRDNPADTLAEGVEPFLEMWERLRYLEPYSWNFRGFQDEHGQPDDAKIAAWQELFG